MSKRGVFDHSQDACPAIEWSTEFGRFLAHCSLGGADRHLFHIWQKHSQANPSCKIEFVRLVSGVGRLGKFLYYGMLPDSGAVLMNPTAIGRKDAGVE